MQVRSHLGLITAAVILSLVGIVLLVLSASRSGVGGGGVRGDGGPPPPRATPEHDLRTSLCAAGWSEAAARRVGDLHADWFTALTKEHPAHAQVQLKLLQALGKFAAATDLLEKHPEVAGLLAASDDPSAVARTLSTAGGNYDLVAGLYVQHAAPGDAALLAQALERHRALICRLIRLGLPGAELPFLFRRGTEGAAEYDRWLADELQARAGGTDEERAAFHFFLLDQGPELRQRLKEDARFRAAFRVELWPKLVRGVEPTGNWARYAGEPHLWDLLALSEGERLLRERGRLPLLLLFDDGAYPVELRTRVIRAMLDDDRLLLQALVKFRAEPLFIKLLKRPLPRPRLEAALARLLKAGPSYPADLARFNRLADEDLAEELGPPPDGIETWVPLYYTYYVGKKLYQGRDPTAMEWALAVADPASFLVPELKFSGKAAAAGGKAVSREAASQAFKTILKDEGKAYAMKQFEREAAQAGGRLAADELAGLGAKLLDKGLEHEVAQYGLVALLRRAQEPIRQAVLRGGTVDVTNLVRFLFTYSGLGRQTFKRMTDLEARLFMRGDARVYVRLGNTVAGALTSRVVNGFDDEIADKVIEETGADGQLRVWRQSVAAWFMLNAGGLGDAILARDGRN